MYGLRIDAPQWTREPPVETSASGGSASVRINVGPVAVLAFGDRGPCFEAVVRHVRTVARTTGTAPEGR